MATNNGTIEAMERAVELIDELTAIKNEILLPHIRQQKRQIACKNNVYIYDKQSKKHVHVKIDSTGQKVII